MESGQGMGSRSPVVQRSKMMLEIASELVNTPGWVDRQVQIHFREQGEPEVSADDLGNSGRNRHSRRAAKGGGGTDCEAAGDVEVPARPERRQGGRSGP